MGSEITLQQATILSRYKLVVACFDNDIAGMRGAEQLNILLRSQTEVRFLVLPSSYNDPDNIQDAGTWQSLVRTNIVDYAEYSQERVRDYGDAYRKIRDEVIDSFDVPF
jgi:DNA primase